MAFGRASIRTKWTLTILGVSLASIALLAPVTLVIQRSGLAEAEKSLQVATIGQAGESIRRDVEDAAEATHRVARIFVEPGIGSDDARLSLAREALARTPALDHVGVLAPDGRFVDAIARTGVAATSRSTAVLSKTQQSAARDGGRWLPVEYEAGRALLRFVDEMRQGETLRGFVVGWLDPDLLGQVLAGTSVDRFGRPDRLLLLDESRRILASTDPSAGRVGSDLSGRDIFAGGGIPAETFGQSVEITTPFVDGSGEPMIGTLRTFMEPGWALVVRRPQAEAFAALTRARSAFLFSAGVFALAAIAAGTVLARRTTRPIAALVDLTRAYGRREFTARSAVRTGDEIQVLGDSLGRMADDLVASEAEVMRRAAIEADLARYLPAEVVRSVSEGKARLALGGERRHVSVLFADVVSFTTFAERAEPERVVEFLNQLFTVLTEVVFRHEGTVDKFIGDCIMAAFGTLDDRSDHAVRALAAAEDMHRFVEASRPAWTERYGFEVRLGIGVNCGEALVGNLGSEARMEYTMVGDTVNVAARLEGLARPGQTLLTAEIARAAGEGFSFRPLGAHPLRGKRQTVDVFELA